MNKRYVAQKQYYSERWEVIDTYTDGIVMYDMPQYEAMILALQANKDFEKREALFYRPTNQQPDESEDASE
jgi:hypothetical protein